MKPVGIRRWLVVPVVRGFESRHTPCKVEGRSIVPKKMADERTELIHRAKIMYYQQKMTQRDIAAALKVSQPTVSDWVRRVSLQEKIAQRIRAQLVCCEIYQRMEDAYDPEDDTAWKELRHSRDYHDICFYGEWAARLAEEVK